MTDFFPPDQTVPSTVVNGVVTCLFQGAPYAREIRRLIVTCSAQSKVNIYLGQPGGILLGTNSFGARNTWSPVNPAPIPAGSPIYVQYPDATPGTDTASTTLAAVGKMP